MAKEVVIYMCMYTHTKWSSTQPEKEWNPAICNDMDGTWKYYAKWDKSEKYKCCMISLIYGI